MSRNKQNDIRLEPLELDELAFLKRRYKKDRDVYVRVYIIILFVALIICYAIGWYKNPEEIGEFFSIKKFLLLFILLSGISTFAVGVSYLSYTHPIFRDIKHAQKCVEHAEITHKKFMPQTQQYFFYLNSAYVLSIEVSQDDFINFQELDEVSVEFTPRSKIYLQYF